MKIDEYEHMVEKTDRPIVIDFWAAWCVPCRMMEPALRKIEEKYQNQVEVVKINTDESQELIRKLGVQSIPTLMGYRDGEVVFRVSGVQSSTAIDRLFSRLTGENIQPSGPSQLDRIIRIGAGMVLVAIGIASGPLYWLIALGGLVLFSAVYDRCPIYKALAPRLKAFLKL